jgi:hypothetical protein
LIRDFRGGIHVPSLAVEDKPQQTTEKQDDCGVEERDRLDCWFKLAADKKQAQQRCENYGGDKADHPRGKEGADHVDGWCASTTGAQETTSNAERER